MTNTADRITQAATAALSLFIEATEQIPAGSFDQPSNLADWNLRELVAHATGSAAKIVTLVADGEVWDGPSRPADFTSEAPVLTLRELATRLAATLPTTELDAVRVTPQGEVPLHRALALPVCDLAIHSWDVHRSLGRSLELPDDLLAFCRALVDSVPDAALRRPGAFGPAQPAPAGASPTDTLMAYLGRSVG